MKYYRNILWFVAVSVSIILLLSDTCLSSTANQSSWSSNEESNGPDSYVQNDSINSIHKNHHT